MRTTHFWNNLHQERKIEKPNNLKLLKLSVREYRRSN